MVLPSASPPAHPGEQPAAPPPNDDRPPWPVWIAPAGLVLGFMLASIGTIVVDAIAHAGGSSLSNPSPAANIISDIVFDLCFVGAALWLTSRRGRPRVADFGYRWVTPVTGIAAVVLGAIGYYGVTAIYAVVVKTNQTDKLPSDLGVTHSTAALVAASLFVCAIAPMAEEFFFRGFLFGTLRNLPLRIGRYDVASWVAAVVTGLLFGLAHLGSAPAVYLVPLAFLGFVLCLIRWRTRSLYPCMALHSANNALALGVNQLGWSVPEIGGLILASWLVIGVITGPLGARVQQRA
ncbi:MAG TPA: type II CAAX endopeptidase family protein [Solirubrobacteraceae bacterium]|nr:type II CAAX endopeptidase family protein [Solirubrobacteraceae bacterium]